MTNRSSIARQSMRAALHLRRSLAISRERPVNPFDVAHATGTEVWFTDTPSLEGMFARTDVARIFLPSLRHRPLGRLCFSCAHELGHAQLGHGNRVDQYFKTKQSPVDPEEFAADVFASSMLMPRAAVLNAFQSRSITTTAPSPLEMLTVAFELCVGFETLVKHLHWGLDLIERVVMDRLLKSTPKSIRLEAFGSVEPVVIVPLDHSWRADALDLEIGHAIALPNDTAVDSVSSHFDEVASAGSWKILVAMRPGIVNFKRAGSSVALRVARAGFVGPWRYRYLEDGEGT